MILGASVMAIRPSSPRRPRRGLACSAATAARSDAMAALSACRPTLRRTRTRVPWFGMVSDRRPARRSSTSASKLSGVCAADVAMVDLHARRLVAVGQALGLVQREDTVGRRPAGAHTEGRLGVLQQLERAAEQAGDVGAHRHGVGADRLDVQHVVEGRGAPHLGRGHAAELGDLAQGLGDQPAVLLLGQVAQRDEGRARLGVERDELLGPAADVGGEVAHRSTSPMTGSTEEMTATASAMVPPRSSSGSACRLTKLGARMCMRNGFEVPSETM